MITVIRTILSPPELSILYKIERDLLFDSRVTGRSSEPARLLLVFSFFFFHVDGFWDSRPAARGHRSPCFLFDLCPPSAVNGPQEITCAFNLSFWVWLLIAVVGCCNKLKDTEGISRQDPYVCLEYGSTKFRTRTCTGSCWLCIVNEAPYFPFCTIFRSKD